MGQRCFWPGCNDKPPCISVIMKAFLARLPEYLPTNLRYVSKKIAAANGPEISSVAARRPRGAGTYAPLIIAADNLDAASAVPRWGDTYIGRKIL